MSDNIVDEFASELIVGLVSAVGTENSLVINLLKERLDRAGYTTQVIKVSQDVIPSLCDVPEHRNDHFNRISSLMDAGNRARGAGGDDVLARGAAARISAQRTKDDSGLTRPLSKVAFIIDSLKRPEEVQELRQIYPSGFVLIGIHADEAKRRTHLIHDLGISNQNADELIRRDHEESKVEHGQRVTKTFYLADFFVRISESLPRLRCDIQRMVELWFGNPFITPTPDEHAMFLAFSASLRSADLSRQVGAVITRDSPILATGANDCPKAGGGLYWPILKPDGCIGDIPLGRDHTRPDGDSNRAAQIRIIEQIVNDGYKEYGFNHDQLRALLSKSVICDL
ncbi:MAG: cytidine deaminase, partial [Planctomycetaceae bacterium]